MNYTRRTWLTAAGAVGVSAALTRCGGGDPLAVTIGRMTVALRRSHARAMQVEAI